MQSDFFGIKVNKMNIETTKMGERGQIVIPLEFREQLKLKKGEKLIVVLDEPRVIVEAVKDVDSATIEEFKEELADIKIANKFWDDVKKGNVIRQSKEEFLAELEEW